MNTHHVIVYHEPGRFCAWPAHNGLWSWGDEILVCFSFGYYKESIKGHSIDDDKPSQLVVARSLDGGETWALERVYTNLQDLPPITIDHRVTIADSAAEAFANPGGVQSLPDSRIDAHPDFALRCEGGSFWISYDRAKTWSGSNSLPINVPNLTSRTDYIVNSKDDCHIFLSANDERIEGVYHDRAICARTTNSGQTLDFLGWMTEPVSIRSVMPSTVRVSDNHLVSTMRRRRDASDRNYNWIDAYQSTDNGVTWEFLSKVADTDGGEWNGNPPSMVRMTDGRLAVTYGYRDEPRGIRAKVSEDNGVTWGDEIILRDDARTWDFGYTRTKQRTDGKLVTVYYYTTEAHREQHIAATIWEAN